MNASETLLSGRTGVELHGFDLTRLDQPQTDLIHDAFTRHSVLLLRDQSLSPRAQIDFTRLFGVCEPHPLASHRGPAEHPELLVVEHRPGLRSRRNDVWHSDVSFDPNPPAVTVLHAIEVPPGRGDTLICNLVAACDSLSEGLRRTLSTMRAVHSAGPEVEQVHRQDSGHGDLLAPPPTLHPVIYTDRGSGQLSIYVNPYYTTHFEDMTEAESKPLLEYLVETALQPENIYRHRWRAGDVLLWDNRRTMHYAIRDYGDDVVRIMHRTTASAVNSGTGQ